MCIGFPDSLDFIIKIKLLSHYLYVERLDREDSRAGRLGWSLGWVLGS